MLLKQTTYQHRAEFLAAIFGDECAWLCINASHEVMYLYFAARSGPAKTGLAALVPQALDTIPNIILLCVVSVIPCPEVIQNA